MQDVYILYFKMHSLNTDILMWSVLGRETCYFNLFISNLFFRNSRGILRNTHLLCGLSGYCQTLADYTRTAAEQRLPHVVMRQCIAFHKQYLGLPERSNQFCLKHYKPDSQTCTKISPYSQCQEYNFSLNIFFNRAF